MTWLAPATGFKPPLLPKSLLIKSGLHLATQQGFLFCRVEMRLLEELYSGHCMIMLKSSVRSRIPTPDFFYKRLMLYPPCYNYCPPRSPLAAATNVMGHWTISLWQNSAVQSHSSTPVGLKLAGRLIDYEALSRLRGQIVLKSLEFGFKSNQGGILPILQITAFNI